MTANSHSASGDWAGLAQLVTALECKARHGEEDARTIVAAAQWWLLPLVTAAWQEVPRVDGRRALGGLKRRLETLIKDGGVSPPAPP